MKFLNLGNSPHHTPYQPERSQGTLVTGFISVFFPSSQVLKQSIHRCMIDLLLFLKQLLVPKGQGNVKGRVLLAGSLFPEDISFLQTHANGTNLEFTIAPINLSSGRLDYQNLKVF